MSPSTSGRSHRSFLLRRGNLLEEVDVAFVPRMDVQRQLGVTRLFEHGGLLEMCEAEAAHFSRSMGCQQASASRPRHEFTAQVLVRPVRAIA